MQSSQLRKEEGSKRHHGVTRRVILDEGAVAEVLSKYSSDPVACLKTLSRLGAAEDSSISKSKSPAEANLKDKPEVKDVRSSSPSPRKKS